MRTYKTKRLVNFKLAYSWKKKEKRKRDLPKLQISCRTDVEVIGKYNIQVSALIVGFWLPIIFIGNRTLWNKTDSFASSEKNEKIKEWHFFSSTISWPSHSIKPLFLLNKLKESHQTHILEFQQYHPSPGSKFFWDTRRTGVSLLVNWAFPLQLCQCFWCLQCRILEC